MIIAVIFDFDGTIADTRDVVVQSFQSVLRGIGCLVSDEFIERWIGIGTKKTLQKAFIECDMRFDDVMLDNLAVEKVRIQTGLTTGVRLFEGAVELLEELQGRIKIALATMSGRRVVDKLLSEKNVGKFTVHRLLSLSFTITGQRR